MSWYNVATAASLDALKSAIPLKYQEVPFGKRTRIIIDSTPFPIAPLFDVAGAELAAKLLVHGGQLIDVWGEGAFKGIIEIESVDTASASQDPSGATMGLPQVVMWIGVVAVLPLVIRLASLMANFIPTGSDGGGGGIFDYLTTLFGDYTPYILIGAAVILLYVLSQRGRSQQSGVTYILPPGSRKR